MEKDSEIRDQARKSVERARNLARSPSEETELLIAGAVEVAVGYDRKRVQELLVANNEYLQRARKAEALLQALREDRELEQRLHRSILARAEVRAQIVDHSSDLIENAFADVCEALGCEIHRDAAVSAIERLIKKVDGLQVENAKLCAQGDALSYKNSELEKTLNGQKQVRHLKRGSFYRVLGELEFQLAKPDKDTMTQFPYSIIREGMPITVYRSEDGKLYGRFPDEFADGRFQEIKEATDGEAQS